MLGAPVATAEGAAHFHICPLVERAGGFTSSLELAVAAPAQLLRLLQPGTAGSGALDLRVPEGTDSVTITVSSGPLELSQSVPLPR
jgi:hypothetical protein